MARPEKEGKGGKKGPCTLTGRSRRKGRPPLPFVNSGKEFEILCPSRVNASSNLGVEINNSPEDNLRFCGKISLLSKKILDRMILYFEIFQYEGEYSVHPGG
ncbi:hypothetical protein MASR1M66_07910 [Aminivibrio sp.]